MPIIAGIEEAGRGPVIGPLVLAIAVIDPREESQLSAIGVKDSKLLSPKKRTELYKALKEMLATYKYIIIPPIEIDTALQSNNSNLNWLEADKTVELVKQVIQDFQIDQLLIDCPSTNIESYAAYLDNRLELDPSCVKAEHKADRNYPIVSAASIIAKVIRDREIKKLHKKYKVNFGSGYSSDSRTVNFLKKLAIKHKKFPDFVRNSWETAKNILDEVKQKRLDDFK